MSKPKATVRITMLTDDEETGFKAGDRHEVDGPVGAKLVFGGKAEWQRLTNAREKEFAGSGISRRTPENKAAIEKVEAERAKAAIEARDARRAGRTHATPAAEAPKSKGSKPARAGSG